VGAIARGPRPRRGDNAQRARACCALRRRARTCPRRAAPAPPPPGAPARPRRCPRAIRLPRRPMRAQEKKLMSVAAVFMVRPRWRGAAGQRGRQRRAAAPAPCAPPHARPLMHAPLNPHRADRWRAVRAGDPLLHEQDHICRNARRRARGVPRPPAAARRRGRRLCAVRGAARLAVRRAEQPVRAQPAGAPVCSTHARGVVVPWCGGGGGGAPQQPGRRDAAAAHGNHGCQRHAAAQQPAEPARNPCPLQTCTSRAS
jgi:hypothetical protein